MDNGDFMCWYILGLKGLIGFTISCLTPTIQSLNSGSLMNHISQHKPLPQLPNHTLLLVISVIYMPGRKVKRIAQKQLKKVRNTNTETNEEEKDN